jgi:hypothetical protein
VPLLLLLLLLLLSLLLLLRLPLLLLLALFGLLGMAPLPVLLLRLPLLLLLLLLALLWAVSLLPASLLLVPSSLPLLGSWTPKHLQARLISSWISCAPASISALCCTAYSAVHRSSATHWLWMSRKSAYFANGPPHCLKALVELLTCGSCHMVDRMVRFLFPQPARCFSARCPCSNSSSRKHQGQLPVVSNMIRCMPRP